MPKPSASDIAAGLRNITMNASLNDAFLISPSVCVWVIGLVSRMRNMSMNAQTMPIPPKSINGMRQPSSEPTDGMSANIPDTQLQITMPA